MSDLNKLSEEIELKLCDDFKKIDQISLFNQEKVLNAFIKNRIALQHFHPTTGYGYDDLGRDTLSKLFADVFCAELSLVSSHILSGTHALSVALFGVLRPGDLLLSITGKPYDTLEDVISKAGAGSLRDFCIDFDSIDLTESGEFDWGKIEDSIKKRVPKVVFIQRSRGYTARNPISVQRIDQAAERIKSLDKNIIIFVDNCYGEFTEKSEPKVDLFAGSLIKNPGGGIAPSGGYIAGKKEFVELCANRLTTVSTGNEVGSNAAGYLPYYQGLFLAPHVTAQSLKGALFMGELMKLIGYRVVPEQTCDCYDIIRSIEFPSKEELIEFCRAIQYASPVDSYVTPYPWDMPGYNDQVIMAAGCFIQGSSIELSCDAPIRAPYIVYVQGGLTYEHVKIAAIRCAEKLVGLRKTNV